MFEARSASGVLFSNHIRSSTVVRTELRAEIVEDKYKKNVSEKFQMPVPGLMCVSKGSSIFDLNSLSLFRAHAAAVGVGGAASHPGATSPTTDTLSPGSSCCS